MSFKKLGSSKYLISLILIMFPPVFLLLFNKILIYHITIMKINLNPDLFELTILSCIHIESLSSNSLTAFIPIYTCLWE